LDLFCKAGGAAVGYWRAGFDVVGVDIEPQPHYPFAFWQGDALEVLANVERQFSAIHASPPCQAFSALRSLGNARKDHVDLLTPIRPLLKASRLPFVIENVPGAPMRQDFVLCGTQFGLGAGESVLRRHRWFETSFAPPALVGLQPCAHTPGATVMVYGHGTPGHLYRMARSVNVYRQPGGTSTRDGLAFHSQAERCEAMGIGWMNRGELSQAIPPAYTEYLGHHLMRAVREARA